MNDESRRITALKPGGVARPLRLGPESGSLGARPAETEIVEQQQSTADAWADLVPLRLSAEARDRGRLVALARGEPGQTVFNMLRTRVAQAMAAEGWTRIAITSPTKGCGKSFVSANLGLALARRKQARIGLIDLDLRRPSLARVFAVDTPGAITAFLDGHAAPTEHFRRLGPNLAVGFNGLVHADAAERLQHPTTAAALDGLVETLGLDIVIYDMPPMLACDDVLSLLPEIDCILMVAGGGTTRAGEVERCAKLLEGKKPLLGVVLNEADDPGTERYYYYY